MPSNVKKVFVVKKLTLKQLALILEAEIVGNADVEVTGLMPLDLAEADKLTFAVEDQHIKQIPSSKAVAVIVSKPVANCEKPLLIVKDMQRAIIATQKEFAPAIPSPAVGIHKSAVVAENAEIDASASICACAVIEDNVKIGKTSIIGPNCYIGPNVIIGDNCRLDAGVAVYHDCIIKNNVIIQANSAIGGTGFGYYFLDGAHQLIPHNGSVIIEEGCEIGLCSCVDRAKFGNTVIGAGTKIDNLCQIGHNVTIGRACIFAGQSGVGGSTKLGDAVIIGGNSGVVDNVSIGSGAMLAASSTIMQDVPAGKKIFGTPAYDAKAALKAVMAARKVPEMLKLLRNIEKRVKKLETPEDN
jgi:UDP-3-O-[3-hydroxymyristoyl] glucosamine N-acyltransferase